jgi:predicted nucleic acid-binding protein
VTAVVDTNVVAYCLLNTQAHAQESRLALDRASTLLAPMHWEAELTNVVWMAIRGGVLDETEGPVRLGLARRLGVESVATSTLCQGHFCGPSRPASVSTTPSSWNWRHGRTARC